MQRMTIIVPQANNDGEAFSKMTFANLHQTLRNLFGGFTRTKVYGQWVNPDDDTWENDISWRYEILTDNSYEKLQGYARRLCSILNQQCILTTCETVPRVDFNE